MKKPATITCAHTPKTGERMTSHSHSTWEELATCADGGEIIVMVTPSEPVAPVAPPIDPPATPKAASTVPTAASDGASPGVVHVDARPTARQLYRVMKQGGSWRDATQLTRAAVSTLMNYLDDPEKADLFKLPDVPSLEDEAWELYPYEREWRRGNLGEHWDNAYAWEDFMEGRSPKDAVEVTVSADCKVEIASKSKLETMMPLFDAIPDGYYGIDLGDGSSIKYLRIDKVTHGTKKGARKVQTIHGDALDDAWIKWPSGRVTVYKSGVEDLILAAMTDHMGAMRRYARTIGRCCRCGKRLTDERSRHYGIGPECEKYMPSIITAVDLENGIG